MENIIIDKSGIFLIIGALILFALKYFFNLKPKFVLPKSIFPKKVLFFKFIKISLFFVVLSSFLQIKFLVGRTVQVEYNMPIQILFDVSLSMTADDIKPSRFDAAKSAVSSLMKELEGYSFSLITFSGAPFVYMPFSDDLKSILSLRSGTDLTDFPPVNDFVGTAIGDALILAIQNLDNNKNNQDENNQNKNNIKNNLVKKIVVLITDGDSNIGYDPLQLIPSLQENNIVVFALGVGEQDYLIGYDYFDTPIKTSINTSLLMKLAEDTGGKFYRILDEKKFFVVFEEIVEIVKGQEKYIVLDNYRNLNLVLYPLVVSFLSILLWFRISVLRINKKNINK